MDFPSFMQWAFLGVVSGGVMILYQMKSSMNEIHTKLAVFVEKFEHHQEKLEKFEVRLDSMERITLSCEFHRQK